MVMRFSRDELNSSDPQKIAEGLSRPVIYHRKRDDMTDVVLKYLNDTFSKAGPGPATAGGSKKGQIERVKGEVKRGASRTDE